MTSMSVLGIEYVNVLNSAYNTVECKSSRMDISKDESVPTWGWIAIICCVVITLVAVISIGLYCILDKRHTRSLNCGNK